jgi:hypothetical protein
MHRDSAPMKRCSVGPCRGDDADAEARADTGGRLSGIRRGVFGAAVANAEKVAVRRVFYAGAQSVLDILLAGLEPTVEVTEREVDRVEALSDELRRFAEEMEAGRA